MIRRAEGKDIPAVTELLLQVCEVHHIGRPDIFNHQAMKYTPSQLAEIFADSSRPVFVYEDEKGAVIGHAFCVLQETDPGNHALAHIKTLYIDDICVDENHRGNHVASQLYEYVKAFAKENGCRSITLNVWACNPGALAFYKSRGMEIQKYGMEELL